MKTNWCVLLAALSVSCVSMGRKVDTAKVQNIEICKTTEQDVLAWFGEPYQRGNDSGFSTLQWRYAKNGVFGGAETQQVIIYLNRNKKVVEFQLNPTASLVQITDKCAPPPAHPPAPAEPSAP